MNLGRLFALTAPQPRALGGGGAWYATTGVLGFIGFLLIPLAADWDGTRVRVFRVTTDGFEGSGVREAALASFAHECCGWAWTVFIILYAVPVVLFQLADSFSIAQTLWLRFTPMRASELASARASRLAGAVLGLLAVGTPLVLLVCGRLGIGPAGPLLTLTAAAVHLLLAGGLVLALGHLTALPVERHLLAGLAGLAPVMSWVCWWVARPAPGSWPARWWPFVTPVVPVDDTGWRHLVAAAGLGTVLVVASILRVVSLRDDQLPQTQLKGIS